MSNIAKILKYNGFNTAAFGKWHQTAVWETSISGPFDRWPNGQGFEEFYGFIGGETNQWDPNVYHNYNHVEPKTTEEYHFLKDMTNKAIDWMKFQKAMTPDKPYFVYFAPGAVHAPHHVPESYIKKQKGKFDKGWDVIREETLQRQIEMGVVPKSTKLAPKAPGIKEWKDLNDNEKKLFTRQAEVFAAFLEMTDYEIGRFIDAAEELDAENTMVIYLLGDNGTSAEGGMIGLLNEATYFNQEKEWATVDVMLKNYDNWGDYTTNPHMAAGWAIAFDAPFGYAKQVASDYGGTRNGMIIKWPNKMKEIEKFRTQWHHAVDIAPIILEACDLPEPTVVDGVPQIPMAGTSLLYTLKNPDQPTHKTIQYFEILGNRGLYYDGWFARTIHQLPWGGAENPLSEDKWQLYNSEEDFSLVNDLSAKYPDKLKAMQELFIQEAIKNDVLPIDDRKYERFNAQYAGRPDLMAGRSEITLYQGQGGLLENNFLNIKNKSWSIEAELNTKKSKGKTNGVIIQQAGRFGGWSFYTLKGKLYFTYNYLGLRYYTTKSGITLPASDKVNVKMDLNYDGGGAGKGAEVELFVDGKSVGKSKIEKTQPFIFSGDETVNVGFDSESPVVPDAYNRATSQFNQEIKYVTTRISTNK